MMMASRTTSDGTFSGSCLCGKVCYHFDIWTGKAGSNSRFKLPEINHCHCMDCRKFHGAAFGTAAKAMSWKWEFGNSSQSASDSEELLLQSYSQPNGCERYFCRICGSSLAFQSAPPNDDVIYFAMATTDSKIVTVKDDQLEKRQDNLHLLQPSAHIFWDSKVDWLQTKDLDSLPKYSKDRSSDRCHDDDNYHGLKR